MSQLSQSSDIFSGYAQGLQCIPNSIMSLIYHVNKNCELWKLEDIETILRSGNILYKSIGKRTTLLVSDVPQYVQFYNFIYHIKEHNSQIGHISKGDINFNSVPFKEVEPIIVTHKLCVLVIGESAVSIIHSNNNFHVFDPHNRNKYGMPDSNGGSVIIKFSKFNSLLMYIIKLSESLDATVYELMPIKLTKFKMIESNRNITKDKNTPAARRNNNSTTKMNFPAGKNNTQSSDTHCKKLKCSDNNNATASMTQATSTSKTRKRQSENKNIANDRYKKCKLQNNDTISKEIKCTAKRKLATQTINNDRKKPRNDDMEKSIKAEHKLTRKPDGFMQSCCCVCFVF